MAFVIDVVACHTVGWWISRTADAAVALAALELLLNHDGMIGLRMTDSHSKL
ncbi:hypothetical protein ABID43_000389 [Methylobacterium goesingense]|uniref:Transposase n=1 Tax=Methylobacterium goesingense TaxID=243690 RepID=A0ABV2L287_9HYPH